MWIASVTSVCAPSTLGQLAGFPVRPRSMRQIPINIGDPNYDPLFRYGFGLIS